MGKGNVILDFYGGGCGNCVMVDKFLEELAGEMSAKDIALEKINIKDAGGLVEEYGVSSLPTLVFLKDGEVKEKLVGLKPKVLISKKITEIF